MVKENIKKLNLTMTKLKITSYNGQNKLSPWYGDWQGKNKQMSKNWKLIDI